VYLKKQTLKNILSWKISTAFLLFRFAPYLEFNIDALKLRSKIKNLTNVYKSLLLKSLIYKKQIVVAQNNRKFYFKADSFF